MVGFRDAVHAHQRGLNRLNVYPVPDGDTGTNMARTLEAVVAELDGVPDELDPLCRAISHGSLMGARGNSGVILSQILRGLADVFRHAPTVSGREIAKGLSSASTAAYGAVLRPIEGTILTVVRAVAEAAETAAAAGHNLVGVLEAGRTAGQVALDYTPEQLPVLKAAGVVDAGGAGFLLLLDAALHVVDGRPVPEADDSVGPLELVDTPDERHQEAGSVADLRYEVMFFLDLADDHLDRFKARWGEIGDSIVVVGGDGLYNCHIHTNDIGAAIEAPLDLDGRPRAIRVTDLFEEVDAEHHARERSMSAATATAVVAVASGAGLVELFGGLGVHGIVSGGQTANPSTAELLAAVEAAPARTVIVLPNNKNIVAVAQRVGELTTKRVIVVPTVSMPEALAALVTYDPEADPDAAVASMHLGLAGVRSGELTQAVRDAVTDVGPVRSGQWIGLRRGEGVVAVADELADALVALVSSLCDESSSIVTIIEGQGASDAVTDVLRTWLGEHHGEVELEVHLGGQPLYPYLVGVE
jgi:DAK2 domain fusion protein YloV